MCDQCGYPDHFGQIKTSSPIYGTFSGMPCFHGCGAIHKGKTLSDGWEPLWVGDERKLTARCLECSKSARNAKGIIPA